MKHTFEFILLGVIFGLFFYGGACFPHGIVHGGQIPHFTFAQGAALLTLLAVCLLLTIIATILLCWFVRINAKRDNLEKYGVYDPMSDIEILKKMLKD